MVSAACDGLALLGSGAVAALETGPDLVDPVLERGAVAAVVDDVGDEFAALLVPGLGAHPRLDIGADHSPRFELRQADFAASTTTMVW